MKPGNRPKGPGGGKTGVVDMESLEGKLVDTQRSETISTKLQRIAELASERPGEAFTALSHHIDVEFLHEAYRRVRKDGATGVDGKTAADYAANLAGNLEALLNRFKSGQYRAPPVRRVHIPKGDGRKTRPIGIPTFEDKVLQKAVTMVLDAVYEQDFLPCSYGFRPGRSAHQALQQMWRSLTEMGGGWVLDVDVQSFYDTLDHSDLRRFLDQRVRDGVLRHAIGKWLKAGVMEAGGVSYPDAGSPQGGVISPLLSNVYLHEVLDVWFERVVKPCLGGPAVLIRYADDFAIVCRDGGDAQRVMGVLPRRFGRFGLRLHPEKTRLLDFRRPPGWPGNSPTTHGRRDTFDFLGFTHYWSASRKGTWVVKRKTARDRLNRAVQRIAEWCRHHRHMPVSEQQRVLNLKLKGHDAFYGITGNSRALQQLRLAVRRVWRAWLDRRSQRARMDWERFARLHARYPLAPARVVHTVYGRLAAKPCHEEPDA